MFWPLPLSVLVGLALWGWLRQGPWLPPAICTLGYLGARVIVAVLPNIWPQMVCEAVLCAFWLCLARVLFTLDAKVPAYFVACSAMTYPALMLVGLRIEWMGLSPIIAEVFMALAMLAMGGGIYGVADPDRDLAPADPAGSDGRTVVVAKVLARG